MNNSNIDGLEKNIKTKKTAIDSLSINSTYSNNIKKKLIAFNEISVLRQQTNSAIKYFYWKKRL